MGDVWDQRATEGQKGGRGESFETMKERSAKGTREMSLGRRTGNRKMNPKMLKRSDGPYGKKKARAFWSPSAPPSRAHTRESLAIPIPSTRSSFLLRSPIVRPRLSRFQHPSPPWRVFLSEKLPSLWRTTLSNIHVEQEQWYDSLLAGVFVLHRL